MVNLRSKNNTTVLLHTTNKQKNSVSTSLSIIMLNDKQVTAKEKHTSFNEDSRGASASAPCLIGLSGEPLPPRFANALDTIDMRLSLLPLFSSDFGWISRIRCSNFVLACKSLFLSSSKSCAIRVWLSFDASKSWKSIQFHVVIDQTKFKRFSSKSLYYRPKLFSKTTVSSLPLI